MSALHQRAAVAKLNVKNGLAGEVDGDMEVSAVRKQTGETGANAALLDPDYMAMVLAMDTLWVADHGESGSPDEVGA